MKRRGPENIDEYVDGFPSNVQKILQEEEVNDLGR